MLKSVVELKAILTVNWINHFFNGNIY